MRLRAYCCIQFFEHFRAAGQVGIEDCLHIEFEYNKSKFVAPARSCVDSLSNSYENIISCQTISDCFLSALIALHLLPDSGTISTTLLLAKFSSSW